MVKGDKCSRPKRVLDFFFKLPPWEIVDYILQTYGFFVNVRHLHGIGIKPNIKLELDPYLSNVDILESFGILRRYMTTNEKLHPNILRYQV